MTVVLLSIEKLKLDVARRSLELQFSNGANLKWLVWSLGKIWGA
jgi:hypothetical protein